MALVTNQNDQRNIFETTLLMTMNEQCYKFSVTDVPVLLKKCAEYETFQLYRKTCD